MIAPLTLANGAPPSLVNGSVRHEPACQMNTYPVGRSVDFVRGASSDLWNEISEMFAAMSTREYDEEVSKEEAFGLMEISPAKPGVTIVESRTTRNERRMRNYYARRAMVLVKRRAYYLESREQQLEHARKYREANRAAIRAKYREKYANDPAFREKRKAAARNRKRQATPMKIAA